VGHPQQHREGGPDAALERYNTDRLAHVVALAEACELVLRDPFLRANVSDILRRKLRDALQGPVLPTTEDKNTNHGRNILFELNLAAKLWTVGIMPTLGEHPDLSCEIDGKKLLIACKRPLTEGGGRNTIMAARTSLVRESKRDRPGTRGVIALSIGKLVSGGGPLMTTTNEATGTEGLKDLIAEKAKTLHDNRHGTKVVGMLFHVITPVFHTETRLLGLQEQTNAYPLAAEDSGDWRAMRALAAGLETNRA
jgi:hypothetical protein